MLFRQTANQKIRTILTVKNGNCFEMTSTAVSRQIVSFEPNQDTFKYSEVLFISAFIRVGE